MGIVPREFTGLARSFRATMLDCDRAYDGAVNTILAPIKTRLRRKPSLRQQMIVDTIREWKRLPHQQYRLRPVEVLHDSEDDLELVELRVAAGRLLNSEWESDELGVVLTKVRLRVSAGVLSKTLEGSTVVSGHALGRRFERSRAAERSAEAILADVDALVDAHENTRGWLGVDFVGNNYGEPRPMRDVRTWWWWPD